MKVKKERFLKRVLRSKGNPIPNMDMCVYGPGMWLKRIQKRQSCSVPSLPWPSGLQSLRQRGKPRAMQTHPWWRTSLENIKQTWLTQIRVLIMPELWGWSLMVCSHKIWTWWSMWIPSNAEYSVKSMGSDGRHWMLRELPDVVACGVSTSEGMQSSAGHKSQQPAWADPSVSREAELDVLCNFVLQPLIFSSLFIFVWGWNCALLGVPHGLHELAPQTLSPTSAATATAPGVWVERKGECMPCSIEILGLTTVKPAMTELTCESRFFRARTSFSLKAYCIFEESFSLLDRIQHLTIYVTVCSKAGRLWRNRSHICVSYIYPICFLFYQLWK